MSELTWKVLMTVANAGALTTRRVIEEFGPKPNWQALIKDRLLKEYQTIYGPVLALTATGRAQCSQRPGTSRYTVWPYVSGPSTVADRAYQNDALALLQARGYVLTQHEYKSAGKVGAAARDKRPHTHQIIRSVIKLPEQRLHALIVGWRDRGSVWIDPRTGHPYLYASISNGGIKLPQLKRLVRDHKHDLKVWHTPLLIAVPEEGAMRAYLRAMDVKSKALFDPEDQRHPQPGKPWHPAVELIIVPPYRIPG